MKIYQSANVYEAAISRIEWIYNEFPNVVVAVSGGKDSTVILHLSIEVARRLGRLPVKAFFLDQEAEWRQTVEYMRVIQAMPEVALEWYQIQFDIFNATSHSDDMLHCWREGDEWIRDKEPRAIKDNTFGVNRFHDFMDKYLDVVYPGTPACKIGGVRVDESPQRALGLTVVPTYKHITWGRADNSRQQHYALYPIYDWMISDIWHYIAINNIPYNRVYDLMFQKGVQPRRMRVSNLTHEVAVAVLKDVQDIDGETWDEVVARLESANSIKHLDKAALACPRELPPMFASWMEYRDYLLKNLISNDHDREKIAHRFTLCDGKLVGSRHETALYQAEITTIIRNDHYFTGLESFMSSYNKIDNVRARQRAQREGAGA